MKSSFENDGDKKTNDCLFKPYFSKTNGTLLVQYSVPPCQTMYNCQDATVNNALENRIKCKEEGKFDKKATCL
jgi:hypothetical protein